MGEPALKELQAAEAGGFQGLQAETKNRHNSRWDFQADGKWDHGPLVVPTEGLVATPPRPEP